MKDQLRLALRAAILSANIPFNTYEQDWFPGEGELDGDWLVMSESYKSEYAIILKLVQSTEQRETIAGWRSFPITVIQVFHPYYDEGDAFVGMEDAWIVDFDDANPDATFTNPTEAAIHCVNWFMNNEMRMSISNALEADYWQKDKAEREARKQEEL